MENLRPDIMKWSTLCNLLGLTLPFDYIVADDFLPDSDAQILRNSLLSSPGWIYREIPRNLSGELWVAKQHFLDTNNSPTVKELCQILIQLLSPQGITRVVNSWAIISKQVEDHFPHCDGGKLSLNYWLSPLPDGNISNIGGMVLYDVKRPDSMPAEVYSSELGGCVRFVLSKTQGKRHSIPFLYNRAVLFDARTFHSTDTFCLSSNVPKEGARMNLTITFE